MRSLISRSLLLGVLAAGGTPLLAHHSFSMFNTVKKGDKVSAVVSPLKNGDPGSLLTRITLPDGRVLGNGGPAGVGPGTTAPNAGAGASSTLGR